MNACLHILNKPPGHPRVRDCLAQLAAGDRLLLIESGVLMLADSNALHTLPEGVVVQALVADADARGMTEHLINNVQLIDYKGLVQSASEADKIQHW